MRPIVEIQIFDFVTLMMDAIVKPGGEVPHHAGGEPKVPVVFRGPQGWRHPARGAALQSLEAWFCHVPGLVVMAPSPPYDAKGLLTAAIRDDNPVVFLEHKLLTCRRAAPCPSSPTRSLSARRT